MAEPVRLHQVDTITLNAIQCLMRVQSRISWRAGIALKTNGSIHNEPLAHQWNAPGQGGNVQTR